MTRPACLLALVALAVVAAGSAGCAHVLPYQREDLARPSMDPQHEAAQAGFYAHVHDSREGATAAAGVAGGGCGCN